MSLWMGETKRWWKSLGLTVRGSDLDVIYDVKAKLLQTSRTEQGHV